MCARYTVFTEEEIIEMRSIINEVSRKFGDGAVSMGEIRPTNIAPVLTLDNGRLAASPAFWGFPKYNGKGVNINARTDTIIHSLDHPEKYSMWREPILSRRCIIPSTGFFEWSIVLEPERQLTLFSGESNLSVKEPKTKLRFRRPGEAMLYMAGIINTFTDNSGHTKEAFVILTTAASDSMLPFHDRMPVILSSDEREDWIRSESFMREVLTRDGSNLEWKIAG